MADLALAFGGDLALTASGDLLLAEDDAAVEQRIMRRLLTYPGALIWHQEYGAGLGGAVGRPTQGGGLRSAIYAQLQLEARVATSPLPTVSLLAQQDGVVFCSIEYVSVDSMLPQTLAFNVGG
ncbi:MAG: hypothetical protein ACU0B1_10575 [Thermohalobaculum sp.]